MQGETSIIELLRDRTQQLLLHLFVFSSLIWEGWCGSY